MNIQYSTPHTWPNLLIPVEGENVLTVSPIMSWCRAAQLEHGNRHVAKSGPFGFRLNQFLNELHILFYDLLPHQVGDAGRSVLLG